MKVFAFAGFALVTSLTFAQEAPAPPNNVTPQPAEPVSAPKSETASPDPMQYYSRRSDLAFNTKPQVRVDVLMVSISQDQALALLPELRDSSRIEAAQDKILKLITTKEAELVDWPEVTLHSGSRAVSETVTERRYPIEFDQPTEAQTLGSMPNIKRSPPEEALRILRLAGLMVPVSFETRNVGSVLEVEAVVSPDGGAITLQLAPQYIRLEKMVKFTTTPGNKETALAVEQPLFQTRKISTYLTLRNRERRLIFFGKPLESDGKVDLFILGATVIANPAPAR